MKTLIGGAVAAALGLIGLVIWWGSFLMVIKGTIPIMLLLGGGLAILALMNSKTHGKMKQLILVRPKRARMSKNTKKKSTV